MVIEAVAAEQAGFDVYGVSEQHFLPEVATSAAPEGIMNVVASKTEHIRLRFMSAVISVNHPIRIIERLNTLDAMSDGRAELGLARSNNPLTLAAFGVRADETRTRLNEGLPIIFRALTEKVFSADGDIWQIPESAVVPLPVQQPHPPVYISATSDETHALAARIGIGCMSGNTVLGWDYLDNNVQRYRSGIGDAEPLGAFVTNSVGTFAATVACAPTMEEAMADGEAVALAFMDTVMGFYVRLADSSPGYEYLGQIADLKEHAEDIPFLMEFNPYFHIGTPEFLIERFKRLEAMGLNELILRIDGMGHERNMATIEMIGEHVIPHFQRSMTPRTDR
jgi:alkanesulfonate monooxygenase SsuD/methylene tetrahydromethanopterin reductase-like flavin-dependent oxidoreductase (luciferase family)